MLAQDFIRKWNPGWLGFDLGERLSRALVNGGALALHEGTTSDV